MTEIRNRLESLRDEKNAAFVAKLTPTIAAERILGVKTPVIKALAKELFGTEAAKEFLRDLPHFYLEENLLHGFLISREKSFKHCLVQVEAYLPYVDNWAACDQLAAPALKKDLAVLLEHVETWLSSPEPYTVRFGMGALMRYYQKDAFEARHAEMVLDAVTDHYYVEMMAAWYFATLFCFHPEEAMAAIRSPKMKKSVLRMTERKVLDSFRVSPEWKESVRAYRKEIDEKAKQ